ncbi:MAG: tetratricopeptide repeat protein [Kofleriaceae bacterium]
MSDHDDLKDLVKQLDPPAPTESRVEAMRVSLLQAAAEPRHEEKARWPFLAAGFGAGALAAAATAVLVLHHGAVPVQEERAQIEASTAADFDRTVTHNAGGTDEVVRLHAGRISLAVAGLPKQDHVRVAAANGEIEGTGLYEVAVAKDAIQEVTVREGTATVKIIGSHEVFLATGQVWHAPIVTADVTPSGARTGVSSASQSASADSQTLGESSTGATGASASGANGSSGSASTSVSSLGSPSSGTSPASTAQSTSSAVRAPMIRDSRDTHDESRVARTDVPRAGSVDTSMTATGDKPMTNGGRVTTATGDKATDERAHPTDKPADSSSTERVSTVPAVPELSPIANTSPTPAPTDVPTQVPAHKPSTNAELEKHFTAGFQLLQQGKPADAARELETAANAGGDDPLAGDARYFEAVALTKAGRKTEAERALVAFLDRSPHALRRGRAAVMLARLVAERGDTAGARSWYQAAATDSDPAVVRAAKSGLASLSH